MAGEVVDLRGGLVPVNGEHLATRRTVTRRDTGNGSGSQVRPWQGEEDLGGGHSSAITQAEVSRRLGRRTPRE